MNDQLPAVLPLGAVTPAVSDDTLYKVVPAVVAALGDQASWRYVDSSPPISATRTPAAPMRRGVAAGSLVGATIAA